MNMNVIRCIRLLALSALTMLCLKTNAQDRVPQIPLSACDSIVVKSLTDRYGVVYLNGKCGIYDFQKEENVTKIEYGYLAFASRKKLDEEYYTYFTWEEEDTIGFIGVAEANNEFIGIANPKKEDGK